MDDGESKLCMLEHLKPFSRPSVGLWEKPHRGMDRELSRLRFGGESGRLQPPVRLLCLLLGSYASVKVSHPVRLLCF
ncbi:hypothetical protein V6N13_092798 [Hibiscus sabdariffa]|uniref:Uncharacterized protein n=1 Tax=Hibiscus sabdariffa TaxID=183260 RepID=A0ABR2P7V8_9ROSI